MKNIFIVCFAILLPAGHHDKLVKAVHQGDILLFRAWFDDPDNANIQAIYTEAGK